MARKKYKNQVVKFPIKHQLKRPFRTFCRDTDSFKALPVRLKKPTKKAIRYMREFIEHHGLAYSLIVDEDGVVMGGWNQVRKAKASRRKCLSSCQIEGLTEEQKHACASALNELNRKLNKKGGKNYE